MPNNAAAVQVAVSGSVYVAPTATAGPTTHAIALNAAFLSGEVGYLSEDGYTESRERSTENIKAWQGAAVVRTVVTESGARFSFSMLETNPNSVKLFYGVAVNTTDGSVDVDPSNTGGRQSFVLDVVDGTNIVRTYIPLGEVVEVEDVEHNSSAPTQYGVVIQAYPSSSIGGKSFRKWYSALKV